MNTEQIIWLAAYHLWQDETLTTQATNNSNTTPMKKQPALGPTCHEFLPRDVHRTELLQ